MPVIMKNHIKISSARVVLIYSICVLWSAFPPLESYLQDGFVAQSQLAVAMLTFVVGAIVITTTLLLLSKHNRSLKSSAESGPGNR